jgi:hypothetical protein
VNPAWNATTNFTKNSYEVVVSGSNVTSVKRYVSQAPVNAHVETGIYALSLSTPSLSGIVRNSAGQGARDAWVTPIAQNGFEYMWWLGANSRTGGAFSMDLADGIYLLEANPPWSNPLGDTRSKRCEVEIGAGALVDNSGTGWCELEGEVGSKKAIVDLREPNLTFTLKKDANTVVPFGNVGMFLGNWSVWSQADRNGRVSLNIDGQEIKDLTGLTDGSHDIRIVVEPPYGSSDMARVECNSGDAGAVCQAIPDFTPANLAGFDNALVTGFEFVFPAPNTKLQVADPTNQPLAARGSWVVVFEETNNNRQWVAAGNSDANGFVSFNLDTSKTYTVEVNPPQERRGDLAQKIYSGLSHGDLDGGLFGLASPNFKVKLFDTGKQSASRWGWIGVEEVDADGNYVRWITGAGTDRQGQVSLSLEPNKRFKISMNPGQGSLGTRTNCIFETDANSVVTLDDAACIDLVGLTSGVWELELSAGNVVGEAFYMEGGVKKLLSGVLIQASADGRQTQTTTTKADGTYGLTLDEGVEWTIKAFYVAKENDPVFESYAPVAASAVRPGASREERDIAFIID